MLSVLHNTCKMHNARVIYTRSRQRTYKNGSHNHAMLRVFSFIMIQIANGNLLVFEIRTHM